MDSLDRVNISSVGTVCIVSSVNLSEPAGFNVDDEDSTTAVLCEGVVLSSDFEELADSDVCFNSSVRWLVLVDFDVWLTDVAIDDCVEVKKSPTVVVTWGGAVLAEEVSELGDERVGSELEAAPVFETKFVFSEGLIELGDDSDAAEDLRLGELDDGLDVSFELGDDASDEDWLTVFGLGYLGLELEDDSDAEEVLALWETMEGEVFWSFVFVDGLPELCDGSDEVLGDLDIKPDVWLILAVPELSDDLTSSKVLDEDWLTFSDDLNAFEALVVFDKESEDSDPCDIDAFEELSE